MRNKENYILFSQIAASRGCHIQRKPKNQIRRHGITEEFFLLCHTSYIVFNPWSSYKPAIFGSYTVKRFAGDLTFNLNSRKNSDRLLTSITGIDCTVNRKFSADVPDCFWVIFFNSSLSNVSHAVRFICIAAIEIKRIWWRGSCKLDICQHPNKRLILIINIRPTVINRAIGELKVICKLYWLYHTLHVWQIRTHRSRILIKTSYRVSVWALLILQGEAHSFFLWK